MTSPLWVYAKVAFDGEENCENGGGELEESGDEGDDGEGNGDGDSGDEDDGNDSGD